MHCNAHGLFHFASGIKHRVRLYAMERGDNKVVAIAEGSGGDGWPLGELRQRSFCGETGLYL